MSQISTLEPGAVILVEIPFTDLSRNKKRPAVVLLSRGDDHLVAFFTSRTRRAGANDIVIAPCPENGLLVESAVLVTKLFTLHKSLIVRTLGHLGESQHQAVVDRLVNLLRASVAR